MRKGKMMAAALGLLSLVALAGCSSAQASKENVKLRFAYASNSKPVIESMKEFGELVAEKTDGRVTIDYYPDAQLGGETELIELTQTGGIDFTKVSASALEGFSKQYAIFGLPYMFDNEAHFYRVMENDALMSGIYQSTDDLGFVGLTYYDSGQRSFYMVDGPVTKLSDLQGKKIRVMQSSTAIKMVDLLGASPVPMGSGEVYTSLQSNLINGAENNEFVLHTAGHGSVAKYYSYDEHTRVPDIVIMNNTVKDRVSAQDYQAILDAAKESTEYEKRVFKDAVEEEKKVATEEYGVQYNTVDNTEFRAAVQPLLEQYENSDVYGPLFKQIRALAKE